MAPVDYLFLEEVMNSAQAARRTMAHQQQQDDTASNVQVSRRKGKRGRANVEEPEVNEPGGLEEAMGLAPNWLSKYPVPLQKLVKQVRLDHSLEGVLCADPDEFYGLSFRQGDGLSIWYSCLWGCPRGQGIQQSKRASMKRPTRYCCVR